MFAVSAGIDFLRRKDILNKFLNYLTFRGVFLILIHLLNVNLLNSFSRLLVAKDEFKSGVAQSLSNFR